MEATEIKVKDVDVDNSGENNGVVAGVVNGDINVTSQHGLTYSDTKDLCIDLIRDELAKYRNVAAQEATRREKELFARFTDKLTQQGLENTRVLKSFESPSMQFDWIEAQKAYIKAGTPELKEILSDILAKRIQEFDQTLYQLVLSEAIRVAPMLLPSQMACMALTFIIKYSRSNFMFSEADFEAYSNRFYIPLYVLSCRTAVEFLHISSASCAQISMGEAGLPRILRENYGTIFPYSMSEDKVRELVVAWVPEMEGLFDYWKTTPSKNLEINSVGIAIGALYTEKVTGQSFDLKGICEGTAG